MTLLNKTDKSWLITWTSGLLLILALVIGIIAIRPSEAKADPLIFEDADTAFRIVEVRAED